MVRWRFVTGAGLVLLLGRLGTAQETQIDPTFSQYDIYGTPQDVTLDELVRNPEIYDDHPVKTRGRLEILPVSGSRIYALSESITASVVILPVPEVDADFESVGGMRWLGSEVEVTGLFHRASSSATAGSPSVYIRFWKFNGPQERPKGPIKAPLVTLESLIRSPGTRDGQTVKVVGKFRGKNLYGDLPVRSQRDSSDWVIKDDLFAVWVTGRKPKGSGWELDTGLRRDTGKWVEVIGRIESRGGVTYIRAIQVNLASPPSATAEAKPPPPPPERPKVPAVVVFALPLDGEREVPRDSQFIVQFSKDMNEDTFKGHIQLRYAGPTLPGDVTFDSIKLKYDGGRRALTVDPGDALRPGRQVELLFLLGIADIDGLPLAPRSGQPHGEIVDVLRYRVGT